MITLELPTAPLSLNEWQRMHWAVRKRIADRLQSAIIARLLDAGCSIRFGSAHRSPKRDTTARMHPAAKGPRSVRITRRGSRTLDDDNLRGGCKPLVDALVKVGLLEDDTPALVTVEYVQERGVGCRVEVWDERRVA